MKRVIDISEETYEYWITHKHEYVLAEAIANSIPLTEVEEDCISKKQALMAIRNLYPDMPKVDFNGSLRKWVDKYKPYIECDNAIKVLPTVYPKSDKLNRIEQIISDDWKKGYQHSETVARIREVLNDTDRYGNA